MFTGADTIVVEVEVSLRAGKGEGKVEVDSDVESSLGRDGAVRSDTCSSLSLAGGGGVVRPEWPFLTGASDHGSLSLKVS